MKTRWGSCNPESRAIRLNTELVKKPRICWNTWSLPMLHFREPTHGPRFVALLDRHYPAWRESRAELDGLPLTAESWQEQSDQLAAPAKSISGMVAFVPAVSLLPRALRSTRVPMRFPPGAHRSRTST
jgi:hypothetical protein